MAKKELLFKFDKQELFFEFHDKNPQVLKSLTMMAKKYRAKRPSQKVGIATLFEALRWDYYIAVDSDDDFKLNNNFRAYYARLIMRANPDLEGIFDLRASKAAKTKMTISGDEVGDIIYGFNRES